MTSRPCSDPGERRTEAWEAIARRLSVLALVGIAVVAVSLVAMLLLSTVSGWFRDEVSP
jgi:hypothetical protein